MESDAADFLIPLPAVLTQMQSKRACAGISRMQTRFSVMKKSVYPRIG